METVTSFSASLISSLGGDTEKAVEYADMAITDMSDKAQVRRLWRLVRSQDMAFDRPVPDEHLAMQLQI